MLSTPIHSDPVLGFMFSKLRILAVAGIAGLGGFCSQRAQSDDFPGDADRRSGQREGEFGVNIFGLSLHTNRSEGHNEVNPGVGLRYVLWEPAPRWALFSDASIYYDSGRHWAKYVALGASYRFAESWTVGAAVAYAQSKTYNDGKAFFTVIPGVAYEYGPVVFNVVLVPSESSDSKIQGVAFFVTIPLGGQSNARR
jgi:hypothetical protein